MKIKYILLLLTALLLVGCDTESEPEIVENGLQESPYIIELDQEEEELAFQLYSGSTYFQFDYLDSSCSIEINTIYSKFDSISVLPEELIFSDYYIDELYDDIGYVYQVDVYGKLGLEILTSDNSNAKIYFSCINSTL